MIYIYIPIWLDLLSITRNKKYDFVFHLHSNMVRFIMIVLLRKFLLILKIYIPIWLDLLCCVFVIVYIS